MVAICVRWLFEALVTMENSTGEPAPSINVPSGFQEKPADCNIFRAWSTERGLSGNGSGQNRRDNPDRGPHRTEDNAVNREWLLELPEIGGCEA